MTMIMIFSSVKGVMKLAVIRGVEVFSKLPLPEGFLGHFLGVLLVVGGIAVSVTMLVLPKIYFLGVPKERVGRALMKSFYMTAL